ncbi:MAG: hypothetical protein CR986_03035 [Ignavibacteriae bacterium]|nr:MAG: hypothetical protein CR986_03035 [Ignavibacteriota bacterium]
MNWNLIPYQMFTGTFNMDYDLALVKNCNDNTPILRFYGWQPNCITLGANQSYDEINKSATEKHNIDVVKRPTGGRAILHAEELTYSVIMPNSEQISGRLLYEKISKAIVTGLRKFDTTLLDVELENQTPDFQKLLKETSGSLCFASTAKSEIKFQGKKLVGSAQRKLGKTILQHGSILIGKKHRNLVDYLNVDDKEKIKLKDEIAKSTTELSTITNQNIDIFELQDFIITGFKESFNAKFKLQESETSL